MCIEFEDYRSRSSTAQASFKNEGEIAYGDASGSAGSSDQYSGNSLQNLGGIQYQIPIFPYYGAGYGYGSSAGYGAETGYAATAQKAAGYAQSVGLLKYSTSGTAYETESQSVRISGKSCKKYVCSSVTDLEAFYQNGPNYNADARASQ